MTCDRSRRWLATPLLASFSPTLRVTARCTPLRAGRCVCWPGPVPARQPARAAAWCRGGCTAATSASWPIPRAAARKFSLRGLCPELPGCGLARAGAAGRARPDPRLARRPRAGPGHHSRRRAQAAGTRVPARRPGRPGQRAPRPGAEEQHEAEARPRAAGILPRPPQRRAPVHRGHQRLAHEQHQRATATWNRCCARWVNATP
jgi:hypothetical protein